MKFYESYLNILLKVLNWSYILKHLLANSNHLKNQLREERLLDARAGSHTAAHLQSLKG